MSGVSVYRTPPICAMGAPKSTSVSSRFVLLIFSRPSLTEGLIVSNVMTYAVSPLLSFSF